MHATHIRTALATTLVALASLAAPAIADPTIDEPIERPSPDRALAKTLRLPIVAIEQLMVIVPPAIYYWHTPDQQDEDWALGWDRQSWKSKLTSLDPIVLDTNRFEANGIRHPIAGALTYQIGRANGFGILASTAMDLAASVIWEYIAEFKENPSANDMFANTASGFLVGEPLFQIGLLADGRHPSSARRALATLVSPFHRVQRELALSPLDDAAISPNRLELVVGAHGLASSGTDDRVGETRLGLDLEVLRDPRFFVVGDEARWTGPATWNRVAFEIGSGGNANDGFSSARFRSQTTYAGRLAHALDEHGRGSASFVGIGGGFEVVERRLPNEWDKYTIFDVAAPRAALWWNGDDRSLALEASVAANVNMMQAHALAGQPLEMDTSIVRTRGYYYGTGVSGAVRARGRIGRVSAEIESTYHRAWSFDDHAYGGSDDPKNLVDSRAITSASIGVTPTDGDVRIEAYGQRTDRTGTGGGMSRATSERTMGLAVRTAF